MSKQQEGACAYTGKQDNLINAGGTISGTNISLKRQQVVNETTTSERTVRELHR